MFHYIRRHWSDHLFREGIVTGGQYNSKQGCQPYLIATCDHHEPGPHKNCSGMERTPSCRKECESGYSVSYDKDKHYGKNSYSISNDVEKIQTEIMTNGPVESTFNVYADFPTYRSGTYCIPFLFSFTHSCRCLTRSLSTCFWRFSWRPCYQDFGMGHREWYILLVSNGDVCHAFVIVCYNVIHFLIGSLPTHGMILGETKVSADIVHGIN